MKAEYNTRQRAIILEFLKENSAHVSVRDIIAHLNEQGISVGTATVYRTLDKLCEQGTVRKFVIDERSGACYQFVEGTSCNEHFHLKCISCGALIHVDCEFVAEMEDHFFKDHGFTVSSGRTVIYGTCSNCAKIDTPASEGHCSYKCRHH